MKNCKYYDYGNTVPKIYGAFCKFKKTSLTKVLCKNCNYMIPLDGWIEDEREIA